MSDIERIEEYITNIIKTNDSVENLLKIVDDVYSALINKKIPDETVMKKYIEAIYKPFLKFHETKSRVYSRRLHNHLRKNYSPEVLDNLHNLMEPEFLAKVFGNTNLLFFDDARTQQAVQEQMKDFDVEQKLLKCKDGYWGIDIRYSPDFYKLCLCPELLKKIVDFDPYQYSCMFFDVDTPDVTKRLFDDEELAVAAINSSRKYLNTKDYIPQISRFEPLEFIKKSNPSLFERIKNNSLVASYISGTKVAVTLEALEGIGVVDEQFELIGTVKTPVDDKTTILTSNGDGTFTENFSGQRIIHAGVLTKKIANETTMNNVLEVPLAFSDGIVCGESNKNVIATQLYSTKGFETDVRAAVNDKSIKSLENLKMFVEEEISVQNHPQEVEDYFNQIMGTDLSIDDDRKLIG